MCTPRELRSIFDNFFYQVRNSHTDHAIFVHLRRDLFQVRLNLRNDIHSRIVFVSD